MFVCEIAGGTEKNERVRVEAGHEFLSFRKLRTVLQTSAEFKTNRLKSLLA
jgi:hypothetical protein